MYENNRQADDYDVIRKSLMRLRRVCFREVGYSTGDCWCIGSAAEGGNIPCGHAAQASEVDRAGKDFVVLVALGEP